ncbi:winged helix-turn-helix domain-containing protein [Enterococcus rivorum]|uniref:OmpR/PhoB-type domain-containing protein n=1 Tax=Enterococcus rivorum TaxID=762845 RepID=A0A1E5KWV9_9ENTE|nr:winged helix-turn-helix domain-containing protein [Enterococcus rivorum]MBP2097306.1 two-component system response regulator VicR [Enterococcus rivorum]OEH82343.1 hypothetical protein BCR26_02620 [Enterococcus rivorum]
MRKIGWISLGEECDKKLHELENCLFSIHELNAETLAKDLSEVSAVVIHHCLKENSTVIYDWLMDLTMTAHKPIWIITSLEEEYFQRLLLLKFGVVGIIDEKYPIKESLLMLENMLKHIEKVPQPTHNNEKQFIVAENSDIQLNAHNLSMKVNGLEEVEFTRIEYMIISELTKNQGMMLSYEEMVFHIWKEKYSEERRYRLANHVFHIRRKLKKRGANPNIIKTIRSKGYLLANS